MVRVEYLCLFLDYDCGSHHLVDADVDCLCNGFNTVTKHKLGRHFVGLLLRCSFNGSFINF